MSLDPYHIWLGIAPSNQPPDHYGLLGIPRFENDPDVIDHAADRQISHLGQYKNGEHDALAQRLLQEVDAARTCLLDTPAKSTYDAGLRSNLQRAHRQPIVPPPRPTGKRPSRETPFLTPKGTSISARLRHRGRVGGWLVGGGIARRALGRMILLGLEQDGELQFSTISFDGKEQELAGVLEKDPVAKLIQAGNGTAIEPRDDIPRL